MKIYIASHSRWAALHVASVLRSRGHEICSRWINKPFNRVADYTEQEREVIATEDVIDVINCDSLVLVSGPDKYPGGKFVEAGIAIGLGKRVIIIGRRENMLLWLLRVKPSHPRKIYESKTQHNVVNLTTIHKHLR